MNGKKGATKHLIYSNRSIRRPHFKLLKSQKQCARTRVALLCNAQRPLQTVAEHVWTPEGVTGTSHTRLRFDCEMECLKTMSINSWCLIQTVRYLTQNLTRLLRTDEGKFDMCCRHHQPQHVKRSLNILSVPPAKLWYGFQPHVWNRDANIFCANTWMDQQICLDLAGSTLLL